MTLYKGKYRIETTRLQGWDYGSNAPYFVTICTKDREHFFGEISNGEMILSAMGECADQCWQEIPKHFPFVILDEYTIMPNHVHGIVVIDKPDVAVAVGDTVGTGVNADVETQNFASLPSQPPAPTKFGPQSQNLGSIIRGFKIGVTIKAKQLQPDFKWQARYHDHIIRNENSYQRIRDYIRTNPSNWEKDKFY